MCAKWIGLLVRARSIDDGTGQDVTLLASGRLHPQDERCLLAACRFHFVQPSPADTEYPCLQGEL
jgi:hypothetical protein